MDADGVQEQKLNESRISYVFHGLLTMFFSYTKFYSPCLRKSLFVFSVFELPFLVVVIQVRTFREHLLVVNRTRHTTDFLYAAQKSPSAEKNTSTLSLCSVALNSVFIIATVHERPMHALNSRFEKFQNQIMRLAKIV